MNFDSFISLFLSKVCIQKIPDCHVNQLATLFSSWIFSFIQPNTTLCMSPSDGLEEERLFIFVTEDWIQLRCLINLFMFLINFFFLRSKDLVPIVLIGL